MVRRKDPATGVVGELCKGSSPIEDERLVVVWVRSASFVILKWPVVLTVLVNILTDLLQTFFSSEALLSQASEALQVTAGPNT